MPMGQGPLWQWSGHSSKAHAQTQTEGNPVTLPETLGPRIESAIRETSQPARQCGQAKSTNPYGVVEVSGV